MFIRRSRTTIASACRLSVSKSKPFIPFTYMYCIRSMVNYDIGVTIHRKIPTIFQSKNMHEIERKLGELIAAEGNNLDISHLASILHQAAKVNFTILNWSVRRFDEAHAINFSVNTKRRNQADVWTLWCFDSTKTTVVGIVYVTHLETGSFSG